jgi:hypothetical protein
MVVRLSATGASRPSRCTTAPVHRPQYLNIADRMQTEKPRDARRHHFDDQRNRCVRILRPHEIEIAVAIRLRQIWNGSAVDPVRGGDEAAPRRLAENLGQSRYRYGLRGDEGVPGFS